MTWVKQVHRCVLPRLTYNRPELLDVWECDHCKLNWKVVSIQSTGSEGYGRYKVGFKLVPPDFDNDIVSIEGRTV